MISRFLLLLLLPNRKKTFSKEEEREKKKRQIPRMFLGLKEKYKITNFHVWDFCFFL
jgi:hypothetical protein